MATISNTPRPAYAWDSTDNVWYPIGTGAHSHNEIDKTTINAKGDLIVGTANDAYTRQGVGADGSVLIADSTQTTGVNWAGTMQYAGKNKAINGDFAINQRGFSTTGSNDIFFADRFTTTLFSGTVTFTTPTIAYGSFANQTSNKALRITSGSSTNDAGLRTKIEDVSTFAGQTITISCWIRSSGTTCAIDLVEALQYFGTGGSANVYTYADVTGKTYGSGWTRLSFQIAVPSVAGKTIGAGNHLSIRIDPVNGIANGEWIEITHIQVEAGSVATPFVPAGGGAQQAELALCQRYYMRYQDGALYSTYVQGAAFNTTTVQFPFQFPVTMRVAPTSFEYGNVQLSDGGTAYSSGSWSIGGGAAGRTITQAIYTHGSAALTTYRTYRLENANNVNGYVAFSAEL